MKKKSLSLKALFTLVSVSLFIWGCSDNNELLEPETQQSDYSEIARSSEIDEASASIDDISLNVYEVQEASEETNSMVNFNLPDCITVTVVMEQNYREITIDFGTEGCGVHGNLLKGKIILSYTRDPDAKEILITKILEDFYFNQKNLIGGKTILKQLENENGNPQSTHTTNLTIVWPNGTEASRSGVRIREWIEGFGNGIWSDNVFEITGHWTTTFINGNTHNYEVVIPLRREVICFYFVSGSVDVERTNFSGVFDYGEGDCDNMATFTFDNGEIIDVILN